MSLLPFLRPAKEGTKPAAASRGPPSIVNKVYKEVCGASASSNHKSKGKWGEYQTFSDTEKAIVGKYASEHGVTSAIRKFKDKNLKESTVRYWRHYYNREVARLRKEVKVGESVTVDSLPSKKWGKPPLLGAKLDTHLQQLIGNMRSRGTAIGTSVVIGVRTGVLMKHTGKKPPPGKLSKEWAMSVLHRMGYTKRKASSKCKVLPENFEEIKLNFWLTYVWL